MGNDTKMNSPELQSNFHSVYKDFFNSHDIVMSGNAILTWGADISHGISALRIKQKLPLKTFCGANFNTSGKLTLRKVSYYSVHKDSFEEDDFTVFFKYSNQRIVEFLEKFLDEVGFTEGIEIDFLTEAPRGHGFAFSGVVSVLLTYITHLVIGKLGTRTLLDQTSLTDNPIFEELYGFSMSLSNSISLGKSTGANDFAVMLPNNPLPIVYIAKKNITNPVNTENISSESIPEDYYFGNTAVYKDTLPNFLGMDVANIPELPLDYGVIFTGMGYTFSEIESTRERAKRANNRLDTFIADMIQSLQIKDDERIVISKLLSFDKDEVSRKDIDNTNLKILEGFNHLLQNTHDDTVIDAFIETVKNIGLMSFSYQKENKLFFAIRYLFYQYRQFEDEEIGILPFNTGKVGGSLFFVMKDNKSRETLQKVLAHIENDGHIASLDYASWRDGHSADGVQLEQFITKNIYSTYTQEGNVLFADSFGTSYFEDYEAVINREKDCILLDTVGGRIYINGEKLTSKEIHSQNTTIDMFKILLENIGKEVSNTKLPVSTYSQNKNEILGKIVLPIRKLVKERFGKEISLTCSGGITDYYLRLERDDEIRIGIIKKTQS